MSLLIMTAKKSAKMRTENTAPLRRNDSSTNHEANRHKRDRERDQSINQFWFYFEALIPKGNFGPLTRQNSTEKQKPTQESPQENACI